MLDIDNVEVSRSESAHPPHSHISNAYLKHTQKILRCSMIVWIVLEVLAFVLLGCGSINPITGDEQTIFFMSFFEGFSSNSKNCVNSDLDFCLPWTNPLWVQFEQYTVESNRDRRSISTSKAIYAAQVLFILTLGFLLASLIMLVIACIYLGKSSAAFSLYLALGYCLLVSFALGMTSIASITSAPPFSQLEWETFFARGAGDILRSKSSIAASPQVDCQPSIMYEGGALFAGAVAILLVLALWSMFSAYLQGSHIFHKLYMHSGHADATALEMTSRGQPSAINAIAA